MINLITEIAGPLTSLLIALIAVDITIFVLAVTFLGDAIEIAKEEKVKFEQEEIEKFSEQIASLNKKQSELNNKSNKKDLEELQQKINSVLKQRKQSEKNKKKIENRYAMLKCKNSVYVPSCSFLLSMLGFIILGSVADTTAKILLFIFSLIFLVYGIFRLILVLNIAEVVAVDSDKRSQEKAKKIQFESMRLFSESQKPKPIMVINTPNPLNLNQNEESTIRFAVNLDKLRGGYAENLHIFFFLSPELEFVFGDNCTEGLIQNEKFILPNAKTADFVIGNLTGGINFQAELKIKSKDIKGKFILRYNFLCNNYQEHTSNNSMFSIKVG